MPRGIKYVLDDLYNCGDWIDGVDYKFKSSVRKHFRSGLDITLRKLKYRRSGGEKANEGKDDKFCHEGKKEGKTKMEIERVAIGCRVCGYIEEGEGKSAQSSLEGRKIENSIAELESVQLGSSTCKYNEEGDLGNNAKLETGRLIRKYFRKKEYKTKGRQIEEMSDRVSTELAWGMVVKTENFRGEILNGGIIIKKTCSRDILFSVKINDYENKLRCTLGSFKGVKIRMNRRWEVVSIEMFLRSVCGFRKRTTGNSLWELRDINRGANFRGKGIRKSNNREVIVCKSKKKRKMVSIDNGEQNNRCIYSMINFSNRKRILLQYATRIVECCKPKRKLVSSKQGKKHCEIVHIFLSFLLHWGEENEGNSEVGTGKYIEAEITKPCNNISKLQMRGQIGNPILRQRPLDLKRKVHDVSDYATVEKNCKHVVEFRITSRRSESRVSIPYAKRTPWKGDNPNGWSKRGNKCCGKVSLNEHVNRGEKVKGMAVIIYSEQRVDRVSFPEDELYRDDVYIGKFDCRWSINMIHKFGVRLLNWRKGNVGNLKEGRGRCRKYEKRKMRNSVCRVSFKRMSKRHRGKQMDPVLISKLPNRMWNANGALFIDSGNISAGWKRWVSLMGVADINGMNLTWEDILRRPNIESFHWKSSTIHGFFKSVAEKGNRQRKWRKQQLSKGAVVLDAANGLNIGGILDSSENEPPRWNRKKKRNKWRIYRMLISEICKLRLDSKGMIWGLESIIKDSGGKSAHANEIRKCTKMRICYKSGNNKARQKLSLGEFKRISECWCRDWLRRVDNGIGIWSGENNKYGQSVAIWEKRTNKKYLTKLVSPQRRGKVIIPWNSNSSKKVNYSAIRKWINDYG